jgi:hypothetical protein
VLLHFLQIIFFGLEIRWLFFYPRNKTGPEGASLILQDYFFSSAAGAAGVASVVEVVFVSSTALIICISVSL